MRRSKTDIVLDILNICSCGATKTRIVYGANLNSRIAKRYIDELKEKDLIVQENNIFIMTEDGKRYRDKTKELMSIWDQRIKV
ncbi:winged helix-turn-helix domain-containing protein [Methanosalsum natronophilum]|uniref:winged helix-turn-helix domain-containing protein n=1 Tax=Methanosalsum natronophilum TaxID=768733 RepID=UPI002169E328|nr:winged helix-turn-helix domain-containing protein [Methanosalsum natronophilum]MCS3923569.1 putative transcriptional regulator [Methanosalsum natronophilum]